MRHVEKLAKRLMEALFPGARLEYQDDQSTSVPDFYLVQDGVKCGVVEVTSSVDQAIIEGTAALRKSSAGVIPRHLCKHDWLVFPNKHAMIRMIASDADRYLSEIERDGLERFVSGKDSHYSSVLRISKDLGVEGGFVFCTKKPGSIYISRPGGNFNRLGPSVAVKAGLAEAWKADNRKKLICSAAGSRHLAVHIDISNSHAWTSLHDFDPPEEAPDLPSAITDLWLFAETPAPDQCTVWHATQVGWRNLGIVVLTRTY
jgi:hypothetical protein